MTWVHWLLALPEDWRRDAEERAAILEFDAGLTRAAAEARTQQEWSLTCLKTEPLRSPASPRLF